SPKPVDSMRNPLFPANGNYLHAVLIESASCVEPLLEVDLHRSRRIRPFLRRAFYRQNDAKLIQRIPGSSFGSARAVQTGAEREGNRYFKNNVPLKHPRPS